MNLKKSMNELQKNNKRVSVDDYINFLEELSNMRFYPYQRELLKILCKQEENKVMPYFIRPRQSSMKFFYEFLRQFYGIEYHTELAEVNINKMYGDEINTWITEE